LANVDKQIEDYPKTRGYKAPKYLLFIKTLLEAGWSVRLYEGGKRGVSKYIFVKKNEHIYKIRFSNHLPIKSKEENGDCDFYVGVSHHQTSTTEDIIKKLTSLI
jgi:hypothetical protein